MQEAQEAQEAQEGVSCVHTGVGDGVSAREKVETTVKIKSCDTTIVYGFLFPLVSCRSGETGASSPRSVFPGAS